MNKFVRVECINGRVVYLNVANITAIEGNEDECHFTVYTNGLDLEHKLMYFVVEGSVSAFVASLGLSDIIAIKSIN